MGTRMLSTKVAVVTGANKGIGFEVVRALCKKFDGEVYLTAQDENRGKKAVAELEKDGLRPKFHQLAIDNVESIQRLKVFLAEKYEGLDILVNNAGFLVQDKTTPAAEQAKKTLGINFYGTRTVCNALFPLLKPHARVVNVSSSEGEVRKIPSKELKEKFMNPKLTEDHLLKLIEQYFNDVHDGSHIENGWPRTAYQMSKIALTALTFIQQRIFNDTPEKDLVVNAVHPGYVITDMTGQTGVITPQQGAVAPSYCALLPPNVTSPRGQYIWEDCSIMPWNRLI